MVWNVTNALTKANRKGLAMMARVVVCQVLPIFPSRNLALAFVSVFDFC